MIYCIALPRSAYNHGFSTGHSDATLQTPDTFKIAFIGSHGVGKTTLATQVAHGLRDCFPDGVLWAYTAATEPLDILGSWAQALGYDFSSLSDVENRAAALRGVIAEKQLLFILDDVRSVARVRPLLVGGPASATLLTTRDLEVAIALNAQPYSLVEMTQEDGEQLLVRVLESRRHTPRRGRWQRRTRGRPRDPEGAL